MYINPGGSVVKNLPANTGGSGDLSFITRFGRSPGGGNGNPLQYSCLENPMDRGAWWVIVHSIKELDATEHTHLHINQSKLEALF